MRAVLDSSTLISAFLKPRGTCSDLLVATDRGAFDLYLSRELLTDMVGPLRGRPKLQERYRYDQRRIDRFCDRLLRVYEVVPDLPGAVPLDPKDDVIVATAVAARADYLVTGDRKHLLSLGAYEGIQIVTPRAFLDELVKGPDR